MFKGIIRRLQESVDETLKSMALRALIAVPFVVATIFGIAALASRLSSLYGPVTAYGVLAVAFLLIGLIGAALLGGRSDHSESRKEKAVARDILRSDDERETSIDVDTLIAAVTAIGPSVGPVIGRTVLRNWALFILVAAVVFLLHSDRKKASPAE